jgi:hypothetical protein
LSRDLDRGAQVAARGAATLSQQEKNNSADLQRSRANMRAAFRYPDARHHYYCQL